MTVLKTESYRVALTGGINATITKAIYRNSTPFMHDLVLEWANGETVTSTSDLTFSDTDLMALAELFRVAAIGSAEECSKC